MSTAQKILFSIVILLSVVSVAVSLYLLFNFDSMTRDALDGYRLRQIRQNFNYEPASTPDGLPHGFEVRLL
jgi:hypothetical protein